MPHDDRSRDAPEKVRVALTRAEPPPPFQLARSLDEAGPGRLLHIDQRGSVRSPTRFRAIKYGTYGFITTFAIVAAWMYTSLFGVVGAVGVAVWAAVLVRMMSGVWQFNRATVLASVHRIDESEQLVERLQRRRFLGRMLKAHTFRLQAAIFARRGDHEAALLAIREAIVTYRGTFFRRVAFPWLRACEYAEVTILCELGRAHEARERLRAILPGREGDYLRVGRWTSELHLAFAEGRLDMNHDALWERSQQALRMTSSSVLLALCAWGQVQLGDQDMAGHLLQEAFDRQNGLAVDKLHPALWHWMVERRATLTAESAEVETVAAGGELGARAAE